MRKNNMRRLMHRLAISGTDGLLVHPLPGTPLILVAERIEGAWQLTLMHPLQALFFPLGTIDEANHRALWQYLLALEVQKKSQHILVMRALKDGVRAFKQTLALTHNNSP